ncbi:hypothetical protein NX059_000243 [Plenodomus lindquistii]|nr:hypothetical protein NX059_000243 [Plenodomus lindquistii]
MNQAKDLETLQSTMCNVVYYHFACAHSLRRRRSRCAGTKHKITRTSTKAACTAESFLTIHVRNDCGACQLEQWEQDWASKLRRAVAFQDKLRGATDFAKYKMVDSLVHELKNRYTQESWDTRRLFAPVVKRPVSRVSVSFYTTAPSPLSQEVRPEDILEPEKRKQWADMDDNDYDGNYVASTDPLHPVSTDYSHPWDDENDSGSWVLQHLPHEGEEEDVITANHHGDGIDFEGTSWSWEDNVVPVLPIQHQNTEDGSLAARDPNASESSYSISATSISSLDSRNAQKQEEDMAEVVRSFWSVVNSEEPQPYSPRPSSASAPSSPSSPDETAFTAKKSSPLYIN